MPLIDAMRSSNRHVDDRKPELKVFLFLDNSLYKVQNKYIFQNYFLIMEHRASNGFL